MNQLRTSSVQQSHFICPNHNKNIIGIQSEGSSTHQMSYCEDCNVILRNPISLNIFFERYNEVYSQEEQQVKEIFKEFDKPTTELQKLWQLLQKQLDKLNEYIIERVQKRKQSEKRKFKSPDSFTLTDLENIARSYSSLFDKSQLVESKKDNNESSQSLMKYHLESYQKACSQILDDNEKIQNLISLEKQKQDIIQLMEPGKKHVDEKLFCQYHKKKDIKTIFWSDSYVTYCCENCKQKDDTRDQESFSYKLYLDAQQASRKQLLTYIKKKINEQIRRVNVFFSESRKELNSNQEKIYKAIYDLVEIFVGDSQKAKELINVKFLKEFSQQDETSRSSFLFRNNKIKFEPFEKMLSQFIDQFEEKKWSTIEISKVCDELKQNYKNHALLGNPSQILYTFYNEKTSNVYLVYRNNIQAYTISGEKPQKQEPLMYSAQIEIKDFSIRQDELLMIVLISDKIMIYFRDEVKSKFEENFIEVKAKNCQIYQTNNATERSFYYTTEKEIWIAKYSKVWQINSIIQLDEHCSSFNVSQQKIVAIGFSKKYTIWRERGFYEQFFLQLLPDDEKILAIKPSDSFEISGFWMILTNKRFSIYDSKKLYQSKFQDFDSPLQFAMNQNKLIFINKKKLMMLQYDIESFSSQTISDVQNEAYIALGQLNCKTAILIVPGTEPEFITSQLCPLYQTRPPSNKNQRNLLPIKK